VRVGLAQAKGPERSVTEYHQRLLPILERYLSPINARALFDKALGTVGVTNDTPFDRRHVTPLVARLMPSLKLFLGEDAAGLVVREIDKIGPSATPSPPLRIEVEREPDILTARHRARESCLSLVAGSFVTMRVLTIVSELARNIVNYSRGGFIEIQPAEGGIHITATDRGPGIPNLDIILAGKYRSRTGLGLGIVGVRRLAQQFSIQTSADGTCVAAKVLL
jgi:serine/threonine-protein kinase RsbT